VADDDSGQQTGNNAAKAAAWMLDLVAKLVDRFGWPGAFVILGYAFIERNATPAQKQRMIDTFVFGDGLDGAYPLIALGIAGLMIFLAQREIYARRQRVMQHEIDRLASWKSAHQQNVLPVDLNHTGP